MKVNFMCRCYYFFYSSIVKKNINNSAIKAVKEEYYNVFSRAGDIGGNNRLLSSYCLGAFFIALARKSGFTVEECFKLVEKGFRTSSLVKLFMGSGKGYFSEKRMAGRREWSKSTYERHYANDWVVDIIEKGDDFVMGYDYWECGVCKMFKEEGCFQWAKYLCRLDFLLVEIMGIGLRRTSTLAEGGKKCDFRFLEH